MRTANRKRIIAATAFILSLAITATACTQTNESLGGIPEITTSAAPETVPTEEVTDAPETTATEATTTTEATTEETEDTSETEAPEETESTESEETEQEGTWTETAMTATMYVVENCYSREKALIGATPISQHYYGDTVEITALTDTGYYKLAEGGYIHSDYISDTKPAETTAATTTTPAPVITTTEEEPEETTRKPVSTKPAETTAPDLGGGEGGGVIDSNVSIPSNVDLTNPNYKIKSSSRYAYKQLSANEQKLYDNFVDAALHLNRSVSVPSGLSYEQVLKTYTMVYDSEPQLFWLDSSITAGTSMAKLSYRTKNADDIKAMQKEIDSIASNIIAKSNNYSGTVSKLKVFFDTIVLQSEFSKSDTGFNSSIYNGLTAKGPLQCAGYAKTMQYLCDLAGIESCVVRGSNSDGASHAWNVVYCENGYYNLDPTWGDPTNKFGPDYVQYEFFLVPDSWIHNKTHYNVSTLIRGGGNIKLYDPPACTKEACNYFNAYNKLYDNETDAANAIYAAIDEAIANKKHVVQIRVTSKAIYDKLMDKPYWKTFQTYAQGKSSTVASLTRQSSYTPGVQVVHYDIVFK